MDHISEFNRQWNFDLSPALACPLAFHGLHVATTSPFPMWASPCAAGIPNFFYCWAGGDKSLVGCLQPWMHKPGPTGKAWPVGFLYIGLDIQFLIWLYGIRTGTMILWSICGTLRHDSFYFVKPIAVWPNSFCSVSAVQLGATWTAQVWRCLGNKTLMCVPWLGRTKSFWSTQKVPKFVSPLAPIVFRMNTCFALCFTSCPEPLHGICRTWIPFKSNWLCCLRN